MRRATLTTAPASDEMNHADRLYRYAVSADSTMADHLASAAGYIKQLEQALRECQYDKSISRNTELEAVNAELEKASSYSLLKQNEKLKAEVARFRESIESHNSGLDMSCVNQKGTGRCEAYNIRGRDCPDCPRDYKIELQEKGND
jgi:cell division septum initiation protein DivIVA